MKPVPATFTTLPYFRAIAPLCGGSVGAVIVTLMILPAISEAQNGGWDSVNINGTRVQLGMKQAEVLSRLAEKNTLKKTMENQWFVVPKGESELTANMGSVGFVDEKLYTASNELGTSMDAVGANLMNRLYMAIAAAEKSGTPVQIHTEPEAEYEISKMPQRGRTISVFIGRKEYSIQISQSVGVAGPSFITLSESVYQQPQPASAPVPK
jgi:hypothetical protein